MVLTSGSDKCLPQAYRLIFWQFLPQFCSVGFWAYWNGCNKPSTGGGHLKKKLHWAKLCKRAGQ